MNLSIFLCSGHAENPGNTGRLRLFLVIVQALGGYFGQDAAAAVGVVGTGTACVMHAGTVAVSSAGVVAEDKSVDPTAIKAVSCDTHAVAVAESPII
jgi:hypothetical protein